MLPTLNGRIQTRIFMLVVFGGLITLALTPILPGDPDYKTTYLILAAVLVLGVVWELIYHVIQQFRWEKDWPTLFGLLTAINEGVVVWLVVDGTGLLPEELRPSPFVFTVQFLTTWLLVWVAVNGPLRAVFPHWRFRGGRFL